MFLLQLLNRLTTMLTIKQVLIEIPHIFLQTVVYGLVVYILIDFDREVEKFFWYIFMFFTFMYFTFCEMMAVAMTSNNETAAILSTASYAIWNIFAGFLSSLARKFFYNLYSFPCTTLAVILK